MFGCSLAFHPRRITNSSCLVIVSPVQIGDVSRNGDAQRRTTRQAHEYARSNGSCKVVKRQGRPRSGQRCGTLISSLQLQRSRAAAVLQAGSAGVRAARRPVDPVLGPAQGRLDDADRDHEGLKLAVARECGSTGRTDCWPMSVSRELSQENRPFRPCNLLLKTQALTLRQLTTGIKFA